MHAVRVRTPEGQAAEIAALAHEAGIQEACITSVYVHGPDRRAEQVTVEASTPEAKAFLDAVFGHRDFDPQTWSITSRELRAIFTRTPAREITRPLAEPALDVFEDLWQLSHITPSYIARAVSAAILLALGMMDNNPIAIVVAALFLPFLSVVLALSFGLWAQDLPLARQGAFAIIASLVCSVAAGALVAALHGGPMQFSAFEKPLVSFGISAVIGVTAGLSSADDTGRRYLIGVAAAVQYAVFPVWFGISLVLGFPGLSIISERIATFVVNIVTIACMAALVYAVAGMRKEEVDRF